MEIVNIKDTSHKLYYVGGVVRDELLGKPSLDVDIVYEGNAIEDVQYIITTANDVILNLFQNRNIELKKNYIAEIVRTNPDFGTVRVVIDGNETDFASTRTERYDRKGHLPQVENIGCSLKEDVKRRDFTINSLYKSVSSGEILDFTGGLEDLKNKKVRILHNQSFVDDPTRIIRALKFTHRFGFELEENTKKLRDEYLNNINYDMCYKRIKKELIETLGLNSQELFEEFISDRIYKLLTPNEVQIPNTNIENLINKFVPTSGNIWLIYAGILGDLTRLELTKKEQKILNDFEEIKNFKSNESFEIYKNFEGKETESIILYGILVDEEIAEHYLKDLHNIKISITGSDLTELGIPPSAKYKEIFDFLLKEKIKNPKLTIENEIEIVKSNFYK
ncbi:CCA tRNA nucleotidyltransferase [bacterium]|nr:CCA tRNA nucleotidyltransferase [bacterium]